MITFGDTGARALDPAMMKLWRRVAVYTFGVIGVAVAVLVTLIAGEVGAWAALPVAIVTAAAVVTFATIPIAYRRCRYRFTEESLEVERGMWWRSIIAVPYDRIQAVDLEQGPMQRRYGVTELRLRTASTTGVSLPGVPMSEAEEIRRAVLQRAGRSDGI
jgi:uncharacterized protein